MKGKNVLIQGLAAILLNLLNPLACVGLHPLFGNSLKGIGVLVGRADSVKFLLVAGMHARFDQRASLIAQVLGLR
jgi:hypothetical protein